MSAKIVSSRSLIVLLLTGVFIDFACAGATDDGGSNRTTGGGSGTGAVTSSTGTPTAGTGMTGSSGPIGVGVGSGTGGSSSTSTGTSATTSSGASGTTSSGTSGSTTSSAAGSTTVGSGTTTSGGAGGGGGAIGTGGNATDAGARDASVRGTGGTGGAGGTGGRTTGGAGGTGGRGTGGTGGAGTGGTGGASNDPCSAANLVWKTGAKTNFESYPAPGSEECIKFSGCLYQGMFQACSGVKSKAWVMSHNIAAFFPLGSMSLHDICIKSGTKTMVVTVFDTCGDGDCGGCCTENRGSADALIDLESFTDARWGLGDGRIQWADLGPTKGGGCSGN